MGLSAVPSLMVVQCIQMVIERQHLLKGEVAVVVGLNITGMVENMTTCQKGRCAVI